MISALFVIPSYKKPEQLEKCLKALKEMEPLEDSVRIDELVVDNNEQNTGFTKAINKGLRAAHEGGFDYCVALNQDCYLEKSALREIIDFMEKTPKCAIAGIKQISHENPDQIVCGGVGECFPYGRHITGLVSQNDCEISRKMPWANGACMVFRVSNLLDIGLMDESMFLIGSDADICLTARVRGFEVWYIADAVCTHEMGVSSGSSDEKIERIKYKDMQAFASKWVGTDLFKELSLEIFN